MSLPRDLYHFTLELFRFLRNPQAHQEQVRLNIEQNRQARIQALEERYGSLKLEPKPSEEIKNYNQLSEALEFIARCCEEDRPFQPSETVGGRLESSVDEKANRAEHDEASMNHQAGEQRKRHFLTLVEWPQKQQPQGNFETAIDGQELGLALSRLQRKANRLGSFLGATAHQIPSPM